MPKPHLSQRIFNIILVVCFAVTSLALRPIPHAQEITPPPENTPETSDSSQLPVLVPECEGEECTFHQEMWPADQLEVIPEADEPVSALAAARITDLNARPLSDGRWKLCFTAPSGTDAGAVLEIRSRDNDPLTLANWNDRDWSDGYGTAYWSGLGHPGTPGVYHCLYIKTEYPGWDWDEYGRRKYFGARVINGDGSVSTISNIPSLQDSGFRPYPDGYNFDNYGGHYGDMHYWSEYLFPDYDKAAMRRMYGDNNVCESFNWLGNCVLKPSAKTWRDVVNKAMNDGHCEGMSVTSLRFFTGSDSLSNFSNNTNPKTFDLELNRNLRHHIAYYYVKQMTNPVKNYKMDSKQNTPSANLQKIQEHLFGDISNPINLGVCKFDGEIITGCHAITPYAVQENGSGIYLVWVYDNNYPEDSNRQVIIDTNDETWQYTMGSGLGTYYGNANTQTLIPVPISVFAQQSEYPSSGLIDEYLTSVAENKKPLFTNSLGQRIGYVDDEFINEIPGASRSFIAAGDGSALYSLPADDTYTITLNGQDLSEAEAASLSQFGPGFAVSLDDLNLSPGGQSNLTISPDGAQVSLQSGEDQPEASLALARDGEQTSTEFQIAEAEVSAGETLSLTADDVTGAMIFQNGETASTAYQASISRSSESGRELFLAKDLSAAPGETYAFDTASWFGPDGMTMLVDENGDGSFDSSMYLDNQAAYLFVPLISESGEAPPPEESQPASEEVQSAAVEPEPTTLPTQAPPEPSPIPIQTQPPTVQPTSKPTKEPTTLPTIASLVLTVADSSGSGAQAVITLANPQAAGDLTMDLDDGVLTLRSAAIDEAQIDVALQTEDGAPPKVYNGLRVKAKGVYILSSDQNQQVLSLKADLDGDGLFEVQEHPIDQANPNSLRQKVMMMLAVFGILFGLSMIVAGILLLMRVRRES